MTYTLQVLTPGDPLPDLPDDVVKVATIAPSCDGNLCLRLDEHVHLGAIWDRQANVVTVFNSDWTSFQAVPVRSRGQDQADAGVEIDGRPGRIVYWAGTLSELAQAAIDAGYEWGPALFLDALATSGPRV